MTVWSPFFFLNSTSGQVGSVWFYSDLEKLKEERCRRANVCTPNIRERIFLKMYFFLERVSLLCTKRKESELDRNVSINHLERDVAHLSCVIQVLEHWKCEPRRLWTVHMLNAAVTHSSSRLPATQTEKAAWMYSAVSAAPTQPALLPNSNSLSLSL